MKEKFILDEFDVAGYYPAIILNDKLSPSHLGESFLIVYNALVKRRLEAKKAKNNIVSDSLKICVNGSFGKLGSQYSVLFSPDLLIQVTVTGQLALLMLIETLELENISVVSANTDGIVTKCPVLEEDKMLGIIRKWESDTGFITERTPYKALYSRDVNCYLGIKSDNTTKAKNAYFDPWSGGAKTAIFRFHKNPQHTICIEAAIDYITKDVAVRDTIYNCRDITKFVCARKVEGGAIWNGEYLGKVIRWYYALGNFATIKYKNNGHDVPDSYGAKPMMTLSDDIPADINLGWYETRANEILEELSVVNRKSKMTSFFD